MSTVIYDSGVNAFVQSTVGGTLTTPKIFPTLGGASFPTSGFTTPSPQTNALIVNIANNGVSDGRIVTVKASGSLYVHGTSPTVNFLLQQGTSLSNGNNTTVSTLASAQSLTTATQYPFAFEADLQGDSVSGTVQVVNAKFVCNGTSGSLTNTSLTSMSYSVAIPLVFAITFGVSDADNAAQLYEFLVEA